MTAFVENDRPVRLSFRNGLGRSLLPAAVLGALILLLWQLIVTVGGVPAYLVPAPTAILSAIVNNTGMLLSAAQPTATAVIVAVIAGTILGIAASIVISLFEGVARVVLAMVAVASCAPIVALAPIFNAWFGSTSLLSKIAVATIAVGFPVVVNTTRGLLTIDPLHREFLQSISATRFQLLRFVRLPTAMPALFDGVRVGTTMSVIAVIVSEYFGGTANALGVLIANTAALSKFDQTWAAVAVASLLGLVLYGVVALLESVLVPWRSTAASS